ncbi:expressed protein [Phakopsora pachyrhizi]|uniref:Expressed protein n=1 Tax=Phakopsora pachyrhizi TaxID=170000 RepID=A0AAV0B497_PHAPC|nr:expressed protein [Phakopsora pachyrhizi]
MREKVGSLGEKMKRKKKCTEEERSNRKKGSGDISDGSSNPSIEIADEFLPPLDVLWVWYCYCFRSRAYYEDSLRSYPVLNSLRFPIKSIISNYSDLDPQKFLKDKRKFRVLPNVLRWTPTDGSEDDDDEHKTINQRKNNYEIDDEDRTRIDSMIKNWFALTNTEFDPIGFYLNPTLRTTICPSCDDCIEKSSV